MIILRLLFWLKNVLDEINVCIFFIVIFFYLTTQGVFFTLKMCNEMVSIDHTWNEFHYMFIYIYAQLK